MDKTIITSMLIIAGVIGAVLTFNAVLPAVVQSSDAMAGRQRRIDERFKSQIEIVHATGNDSSNAYVWVKNIGSLTIGAIERCDVFFGPEGDFSRIPHQDDAGGSTPWWDYEVEADTKWKPLRTLKITVTYGGAVLSGRYYVKIVGPNGVSDDTFFSE